MKITKKIKQKTGLLWGSFYRLASKHLSRLDKCLRIRARIRFSNIWCKQNPKWFVSIVVIMFSLTLIPLGFHPDSDSSWKRATQEMQSKADVISKFNEIQSRKVETRNSLNDVVKKGITIRQKIDSLLKIKNKTHEDTVEIQSRYKQLKIIYNFLNNSKNDSN